MCGCSHTYGFLHACAHPSAHVCVCVRVCMNVLLLQKLLLRFYHFLNLCRLRLFFFFFFPNQINVSGTDINVISKARQQNTQYNAFLQREKKPQNCNKTSILNSTILYKYKRKRENKEAASCFLFSCGILIYSAARKAAVLLICQDVYLFFSDRGFLSVQCDVGFGVKNSSFKSVLFGHSVKT